MSNQNQTENKTEEKVEYTKKESVFSFSWGMTAIVAVSAAAGYAAAYATTKLLSK
nr:MAG TPA: hypothetical protein [Caudoviricetes sp.]